MSDTQHLAAYTHLILVIDDQPSDRTLYCEWLQQSLGERIMVMGIDSLTQAKLILESCRPDCIILDHLLLDGTGLEYMAFLKEYYGTMPQIVVFVSGVYEIALGERALDRGAVTYLPKNKLTPQLLSFAVKQVLDAHQPPAEQGPTS